MGSKNHQKVLKIDIILALQVFEVFEIKKKIKKYKLS